MAVSRVHIVLIGCIFIISLYQIPTNCRPSGRLHKKLFDKVGKMENFQVEKIKPEVVDDVPAAKLDVVYPSNAVVRIGNELKPTQVKDEPSYTYKGEENQLYTLFFVDPDVPSRSDPKMRNILHQMIHNIPGSDLSRGDVSKGDIAAEYIGSGPPQGTGKHRYIFLLYKQPDGKRIEVQERIKNNSRKGRLQFDLRKFVSEHNLGKPLAGNFYLAKYDDYVPTLHAQLSQA